MRENFMSGLGRGSRKRGLSRRACSLLHSGEALVMGAERRGRVVLILFAGQPEYPEGAG
jgi:hypothetical protein